MRSVRGAGGRRGHARREIRHTTPRGRPRTYETRTTRTVTQHHHFHNHDELHTTTEPPPNTTLRHHLCQIRCRPTMNITSPVPRTPVGDRGSSRGPQPHPRDGGAAPVVSICVLLRWLGGRFAGVADGGVALTLWRWLFAKLKTRIALHNFYSSDSKLTYHLRKHHGAARPALVGPNTTTNIPAPPPPLPNVNIV